MISVFVKSIHTEISPDDGFRVLVDRNLPAGMTEANVQMNLWLGGIAPTPRLHKWLRGDGDRWDGFLQRYFAELDENSFAITELFQKLNKDRLTLLYSSKDAQCNTAVALKQYLQGSE